jgi:hypothetical protein
MRRLLCATILIASLSLCDAQSQDHIFFLSPLVSYDSFRSLGFPNGIEYGAAAGIRLTSTLALAATVALGDRSQPFDLIGGSDQFHVRVIAYGATLEHTFAGEPGSVEAAVLLGGGGVFSAVEKRTVSAGALGVVTIPGRSQTRSFLHAGVRGSIPLTRNVAMTLSPALRVFTPFSSSAADFSIAGGIRVGLF